jgi:peptidoglycan/LPS O-acetylase OafA/YrhL
MFFVVSGFLIIATSMARFGALSQIGWRRFYALRAARILPCLLLMLALGALGIRSFQNHLPVPVPLAALGAHLWHNLLMQRVGISTTRSTSPGRSPSRRCST